jgi:3-hydroxybutyryl-CoA dehydrogenase
MNEQTSESRTNIVAVLGAGTMGAYITYLCAKNDCTVHLFDTSPASIEKARAKHREWAAKDFADGQAAEAVLNNVKVSPSLEQVVAGGAALFIEALPEDLALKRRIFAQLDELCPPGVILTSNSSSLRMSSIETGVRHRERTCNCHFFLPPLMAVEIMGGAATTAQTIESLRSFALSIGLRPFVLRKESTGFLYNRIWRAMKKEVLREVADGIATPEDIDRIVMLAWGWEKGPFAWMDQIGLDVVRDIEMVYYQESGDPKDKPPAFLGEMIARGELGVKSGKGFYAYPDPDYQRPGWMEGTHGSAALEAKPVTRADFVGAWRLVSFESTAEGETTYPFGREAQGCLYYGQGGDMSVILSKPDRKRFAGADAVQAASEEKAAAFDSCFSYFGTFEVKGRAVIHHVKHCTFPNWVGSDLTRFFHFEGDRLILETPPMPSGGKETIWRLVWERIKR